MENEKQTYKNGFVISYCPAHIQAKHVSGKEFILEFGDNVLDMLMRGGDKKVYYKDDGITIDYWINKYGEEIHFHDIDLQSGQAVIDWMKNKYGEEWHYLNDSKVPNYQLVSWYKNKRGEETHYIYDDKRFVVNDLDDYCSIGYPYATWTRDANGCEKHYLYPYRLDYKKDENGFETHYYCGYVSWTRDKEGNEVHYILGKKQLVDYKISADGVRTDRDGIKDNILAKKRRYYANKLLLSDVPTPTIYRKGEAFASKIISEMMSR